MPRPAPRPLLLLPLLLAALSAVACAPRQPPPRDLTQNEVARFQSGNLILGMASLKSINMGNPSEAAIYLETLIYNATLDVLESPEQRFSPKVQAWLIEVAQYRKDHPRPREARTPVDDRLDVLIPLYVTPAKAPARPLPAPSSVGRQRAPGESPVAGQRDHNGNVRPAP